MNDSYQSHPDWEAVNVIEPPLSWRLLIALCKRGQMKKYSHHLYQSKLLNKHDKRTVALKTQISISSHPRGDNEGCQKMSHLFLHILTNAKDMVINACGSSFKN